MTTEADLMRCTQSDFNRLLYEYAKQTGRNVIALLPIMLRKRNELNFDPTKPHITFACSEKDIAPFDGPHGLSQQRSTAAERGHVR